MTHKSYPAKSEAICLFERAWNRTESDDFFDRNLWKRHSYNVAEGAERIAAKSSMIEQDMAYTFGLLHDIGKSIDYRGKKHALAGYRFLLSRGYSEAAYVALTHDFPVKEYDIHRKEALLSSDELEVVITALHSHEYTVFDRLIQVCDVISTPEGYVLMEKRMMQAILRYGSLSESLKQIIMASYDNMRFIENMIGESVYSVLPHVIENTFDNHESG